MRSSATARSGTRIARHCARADSQVWCAVSPQLDGYGGVYCEDVDIAAVHTSDVPDTEVLAVTPGAFGVLPCRRQGQRRAALGLERGTSRP
jgi:hypothetical protein